MPLVLAGKAQNAVEETYFAERIRPLVDGNFVTYVGLVDHRRKNELLGGAAALLFPIQGEEAFGLAMIEAMAVWHAGRRLGAVFGRRDHRSRQDRSVCGFGRGTGGRGSAGRGIGPANRSQQRRESLQPPPHGR
jgi:hypothetical protein